MLTQFLVGVLAVVGRPVGTAAHHARTLIFFLFISLLFPLLYSIHTLKLSKDKSIILDLEMNKKKIYPFELSGSVL